MWHLGGAEIFHAIPLMEQAMEELRNCAVYAKLPEYCAFAIRVQINETSTAMRSHVLQEAHGVMNCLMCSIVKLSA
jgi:hypothetical protein